LEYLTPPERVNAAGQVAQVGDGVLGAAVRGFDQFAGPLEVEFAPGCVVAGAELLPGQPEFHGEGDELGLRAIVQVAFDATEPGG